jgi:hypothetical protein
MPALAEVQLKQYLYADRAAIEDWTGRASLALTERQRPQIFVVEIETRLSEAGNQRARV